MNRTGMLAVAMWLGLAGCSANPPRSAANAAPTCRNATEAEVAALFDRWNGALQSGDARKVLANYADHSILLPTLSATPRTTAEAKLDYFEHFLENQPSGKIDFRFIEIGCNAAFDAGNYTFTFARTGKQVAARYTFTYAWDGAQWLITSHHSSLLPEQK